jgi:hypothetical protein
MIRNTIRNVARKLEHLSHYDIPVERCLDLIESHTRSIEEVVVCEVMRESYQEIAQQVPSFAIHADSSSRTARTPAMAFRR